MRQQDFQRLLEKFSNGECSKEEEEFVLQWYESIQNTGQSAQEFEGDESIEAKAWKNIEPLEAKRKHSRVWYVKIAAVAFLVISSVGALLISGLVKNVSPQSTSRVKDKEVDLLTITNPNQRPFMLKLDDGSEVTLQPNSEIRYPKTFGEQREVYLSGEALFKVTRDTLHPFLVFSNEVVTRVLGTSFTIKAYKSEKEITVSVSSGKVSVYTLPKNGKSTPQSKSTPLILIPNQEAVYQRESQSVEKRLVEKPEIILPEPTLFKMQYDGAPLVKIFEVMEENYGVDIVFDEQQLSECTLTTSLTDEGLYERIQIICKAIGAQYEIKDATIFITSNGCK